MDRIECFPGRSLLQNSCILLRTPLMTSLRPGQFPWQAYILIRPSRKPGKIGYCGGSLISADKVVTAAWVFPPSVWSHSPVSLQALCPSGGQDRVHRVRRNTCSTLLTVVVWGHMFLVVCWDFYGDSQIISPNPIWPRTDRVEKQDPVPLCPQRIRTL